MGMPGLDHPVPQLLVLSLSSGDRLSVAFAGYDPLWCFFTLTSPLVIKWHVYQ